MALNPVRTARLSKSVRGQLALIDGAAGRELADGVLARLADRVGAELDEPAACALAADALQIVPRPDWVELIAGPHPAAAAVASEHADC